MDYLIIDLPPGTGDAPLTMAQTIPITGILVVTTPQDVAMNVATKANGMFNKLNIPIIGVVENMSYLECPNCKEHMTIFGVGGGKKVSEKFGISYIGDIPLNPEITVNSDSGNPIPMINPDSDQAKIFDKIARQMAGRVSVIANELKSQQEAETAGEVPATT